MKKVLITGASDGIGKALANLLDDGNYELFIFGRNQTKLDSLNLKNVKKQYCFDYLNKTDLNKALDDIVSLGGVDVLVNNAGGNIERNEVINIDINNFIDMFNINCIGQLLCTQKLVPLMIDNKQGQVINILSSVCKVNTPGNGAYTASKKAMEAISKALSKEVKDKGVKVCDIYPGGVNTNFRPNYKPEYLDPMVIAKQIKHVIDYNDDGMIQELLIRPTSENNY